MREELQEKFTESQNLIELAHDTYQEEQSNLQQIGNQLTQDLGEKTNSTQVDQNKNEYSCPIIKKERSR